ncbi:hypothetical protein E2C01_084652 [Portunus trituberculatus]|uniref:Uncharacterized protein n=1 Tax=Portunus trituberculatus TaxID=210409 RepID=A0A5B7J4K7_PORTR|nr:hypothetical protein [Portunus trituberculatus]
MKKQEKPNSPPSTRSSKQSDMPSVTPADPATAGLFTSAADGFTADPSSISSFFKPVKRAEPATADPSTSTSDIADDDILSLSAHSVEDE